MRTATATETLRNTLFRYNGTACPGIHPRRLAILAAIQDIRPTTGRDDATVYQHLRSMGRI